MPRLSASYRRPAQVSSVPLATTPLDDQDEQRHSPLGGSDAPPQQRAYLQTHTAAPNEDPSSEEAERTAGERLRRAGVDSLVYAACEDTAEHGVLDSLFRDDEATATLPRIKASTAMTSEATDDPQTRAHRHRCQRRVRPTTTHGLEGGVDQRSGGLQVALNEGNAEELLAEATIEVRTAVAPTALRAVSLQDVTEPRQNPCMPPSAQAGVADGISGPAEDRRHSQPPLRAPPALVTSLPSAPASVDAPPAEAHAGARRGAYAGARQGVSAAPAAHHGSTRISCRTAHTHKAAGSGAPPAPDSHRYVQVWVPRRVEALGESAMSSASPPRSLAPTTEAIRSTQRSPQPVVWRRQGTSSLRQQLHADEDADLQTPHRERSHGHTAAPSPLSSPQWCVSAFERIDVRPFIPANGGMRCCGSGDGHRCERATSARACFTDAEVLEVRGGGRGTQPTEVQHANSVHHVEHVVVDSSCVHWAGGEHPCVNTTEQSTDEYTHAGCEASVKWVHGDEDSEAAIPTGAASTSHMALFIAGCAPEDEAEEAAAGEERSGDTALGCRRPRRCGSSCRDHRVRRVEHEGVLPLCEALPHPDSGHTGTLSAAPLRLCHVPSPLQRPLTEVRITLSWLLHACTLPPVAAALLARCLEIHISAAVSLRETGGATRLGRGDSTSPVEPAPFWISSFAYTQGVQCCATTFASRLMHEAEVTASLAPSSEATPNRGRARPPRDLASGSPAGTAAAEAMACIPWPQWVPSVQGSMQVLTALTSAAFVLINDVAQALNRAAGSRREALAEPITAQTPPDALLRRVCLLRELSTAVFGDAENKKLCRHVRDRLPVHISDLRGLLSRPRCAAALHPTAKAGPVASSPRGGRSTIADELRQPPRAYPVMSPSLCVGQPRHASLTQPSRPADSGVCRMQPVPASSAAPQAPTARYPSMLDLVHHLAHVWMRQCFPALADELRCFIVSNSPGVLVDQWNNNNSSSSSSGGGGISTGNCNANDCFASKTACISKGRGDDEGRRACSGSLTCLSVPAASAPTAALGYHLHDQMYEAIHDFVHGVLHRWDQWSSMSADAAPADASSPLWPCGPSSLQPQRAHHAYGADLQWRAHLNYAKTQSLQWILQDNLRHRAAESHKGVKSRDDAATRDASVRSPNARAIASGSPACLSRTLTDMKAMLEQLTVLPTLFESSLLAQEIHGGLRRAGAAVQLTAPASADDSDSGFHAYFRLFGGIVCYGASLWRDDDVAAVLDALTQSSSASVPSAKAPRDGDASASRFAVGAKRQLACSLETANGIWKQWILPLVVRYHEGSRNAGSERDEVGVKASEARAGASMAPSVWVAPGQSAAPAPSQPCNALAVAHQTVLYALTLLKLVREAQRLVTSGGRAPTAAATAASTTVSSPTSSRKRHRHPSNDCQRHRYGLLRHRVGCSSGSGGGGGCPEEAASQGFRFRYREEDGEVCSSSLCSPCSASSYATLLTATASLAQDHNASGNVSADDGDKEETALDVGDVRGITARNTASGGDGVDKTAAGAPHAARTASWMFDPRESAMNAHGPQHSPAWVVSSSRHFTGAKDIQGDRCELNRFPRTSSVCLSAADRTTSPVESDWRGACLLFAHQWMSRPSPQHKQEQQQQSLCLHATVTRTSSACCAGHVIHRRDLRRVRAFLMCLQHCIQQLQQELAQAQQQQQRDGERKDESACTPSSFSGSKQLPNDRNDRLHVVYDYLYGVLPPGLRAGDCGVIVLDVTPSSSSSSSASISSTAASNLPEEDSGERGALSEFKQRSRRRRCTGQRGDVSANEEETLRLTSTDSMSVSGLDSAESQASTGRVDRERKGGPGGVLGASGLLGTPSSSTTLVSSLSTSPTSTQDTSECGMSSR